MTRLQAGRLAAIAVIATMIGLTVITMTPPIAGPRHACHGWVEIKPRHPNSDLYGGDRTEWLPKCRVIR